ncbi:MAG: helix-turn-helix transcriptional regulator [Lachnospiraceae bacterium]|nr:helix-turn-helix transcriptional regulator [Lachnospiraceae bacterium]
MIKIIKMGEDATHDAEFDVDRPNGFPEYMLLLTRTSGAFLVDDAWSDYPADCAVIFKPYQKQRYHAIEESYTDCWMHFTSDRLITDDHFPFGTPIVMRQPAEFYQLFHIICTQYYGISSHRDTILNHLVESLVHMIADENRTAGFPEIYYQLVSLRKEIHQNPAKNWTVPHMSEKLNISTGYLHAAYQQYFHTTCMNDVIAGRVELACELLASGNLPVSKIAEQCGYNNTEHFIRQFKVYTNTTPGKYRKQNNADYLNFI